MIALRAAKLFKALEIDEIMSIRKVFQRSLEEVRAFLHEIDSNSHHTYQGNTYKVKITTKEVNVPNKK